MVKLIDLGIRDAEGRARNRNVSNNGRIKGTVFKASKKRGQSKLSLEPKLATGQNHSNRCDFHLLKGPVAFTSPGLSNTLH